MTLLEFKPYTSTSLISCFYVKRAAYKTPILIINPIKLMFCMINSIPIHKWEKIVLNINLSTTGIS